MPSMLDRPVLNFDVLFALIEHVDWPTLKSLSLLNHDMNCQAERRLWHDVKIQSNTSYWTPGYTKLFVDNPRRARFVKRLDIGIFSPIKAKEACNMLAIKRVLESCTQLFSLRIFVAHNIAIVARILSAGTLPFRLTSFAVTTGAEGLLDDFFLHQPTIKTYEVIPQDLHRRVQTVSPEVLPSLSVVRGSLRQITSVVKDRPVTGMHVIHLRLADIDALIDVIQSSTADVTELLISMDKPMTDNSILLRLSPVLQRLRVLLIVTRRPMDARNNKQPAVVPGPDMAAALATFPSLELYAFTQRVHPAWPKWDQGDYFGDLKQEANAGREAPPDVSPFLHQCEESCPSLRAVYLRDYQRIHVDGRFARGDSRASFASVASAMDMPVCYDNVGTLQLWLAQTAPVSPPGVKRPAAVTVAVAAKSGAADVMVPARKPHASLGHH